MSPQSSKPSAKQDDYKKVDGDLEMTAALPDAAMIIHILSLHAMNKTADIFLDMDNLSLWLASPQAKAQFIFNMVYNYLQMTHQVTMN